MTAELHTVALEEHFATSAVLERTKDVPGPMTEEAARLQVPLLLDLDARRLEAMDEAGVDVQVISHTAPGLEWVDASEAPALAREANDVLADAIRRHPTRFAGLAALPVSDLAACAPELERAVQLGLRGALLNGTVDGRFLDDPRFEDVLATAERLEVPLYLHPGIPPEAVRKAYYSGFSEPVSATLATAAWGWHSETAIHVLRLLLAGVFDRHPRLDIIVGHMGEMLPVMAVRAETLLAPIAGLERPLRAYFADHVYFTTAGIFDHFAFAAATALVGIDRMMYAIDYPYVPAAPTAAFLTSVALEAHDRARFAGGNATRLLGLPTASDTLVEQSR